MPYNASFLKLPKTIAVAIEVINDVYGTGEERRKALENCEYDYNEIQACVDELFPLFKKYGDDE